jgi:hypothetical protein
MPMAEEYKLLAQLPFADPEAEAVERIAAELGMPVSLGPEGAPEVNTDSFLIYGFLPDDVDQQAVSDLFGLQINLTLVFTDPEQERRSATPVAHSMMKIALLLAAVEGARGVIVTEYTPSSIVLRFDAGQVTLNQDWPGWQTLPDVLAVIPEPRTMKSLQGRN